MTPVKILLVLGCTCASALVPGQAPFMLSGSVTDKATKTPLPFASLTLSGRTISTIANDLGEFSFYIDYSGKTHYQERVQNE